MLERDSTGEMTIKVDQLATAMRTRVQHYMNMFNNIIVER